MVACVTVPSPYIDITLNNRKIDMKNIVIVLMGLCLLFADVGCETKADRERRYRQEDEARERKERFEENIREIQRRAEIEEILEQAWNKYRATNNPELRAMLEEHNNEFSGYVINGKPLRELLQQYPHTERRR